MIAVAKPCRDFEEFETFTSSLAASAICAKKTMAKFGDPWRNNSKAKYLVFI